MGNGIADRLAIGTFGLYPGTFFGAKNLRKMLYTLTCVNAEAALPNNRDIALDIFFLYTAGVHNELDLVMMMNWFAKELN